MADSISRRTLVTWAAAVGAASTANFSLASPAAMPSRWRGAVLQVDEGEFFISGRRRARMRIKIDSTVAHGATMSMVMSEVAPGASIPVHLHLNEDELILIHQGSGLVTLNEQQLPSGAGAFLYAPNGAWHGVENTGHDTLIWCAVYSPPSFEQYFREVGTPSGGTAPPPSPERIAAAARKYGMVFKNP